jgi:hypothetical protein
MSYEPQNSRRAMIMQQLRDHARSFTDLNLGRAWKAWELQNLARDRENALRRGATEEALDAAYWAHGLRQLV